MTKIANSLEQIVQKSKKGFIGKSLGYLFPVFDTYDSVGETEKLLDDPEVKATGIDEKKAYECVLKAHDEYQNLLTAAKLADTADRITSIIGAGIEGFLSFFGGAPGMFTNIIEEGVEMTAKAPFMLMSLFDSHLRYKVPGLLAREAATFCVPTGGDVYDAVTNLYMRTAKEAIKEYAKEKMLEK
ncbi:hypothetical protein KY330_05260 [Candidatus Woesearchaeota archaeon]|nr:hypothetical protein [Candidatus Woesearchaeota archaeon]